MIPRPSEHTQMTYVRTLEDLDVTGERVLLRVDLNVPLGDEPDGTPQVADDTRIRAALPTIEELRRRGAKLILVSHLGRPHGRDERPSLRPVAARLSQLIGAPVTLAPTVVGPEAASLARGLAPGDLLMLENVRYEPGETANDPQLSARLATLADLYVNHAFGTAHRAHASTEESRTCCPAPPGGSCSESSRPSARSCTPPQAAGGGARRRQGSREDRRGRALPGARRLATHRRRDGPPFPRRPRHPLGASTCEEHDLRAARSAMETAAAAHSRFELPEDLVIAREHTMDAERRTLGNVDIPDGWIALDIGPRTSARFAVRIRAAAGVFWNGPMGVFELEPFAHGTRAVASALAAAPGLTVVGEARPFRHYAPTAWSGASATSPQAAAPRSSCCRACPLPGVEALQE